MIFPSRFGILLFCILVGISGGFAQSSKYSVVEKDLILSAPGVSRGDDVGQTWCGRGTLSVLTGLGLAGALKGADGHDWEENLWRAGWRPVPCDSPAGAPYGSVLVYDSDYRRLGENRRGTPGGRWGHVEFVAWENDERVYVSDSPRVKPGGTVLDNFMKRAWVPPSFVSLFRQLQGRDLPFSGYVYRGPKGDGPGTSFPREGSGFESPEQYVLVTGQRGQMVASGEVGRGDGDFPLGPSVVGPNPLLGQAIPYDGPSGQAWRANQARKFGIPPISSQIVEHDFIGLDGLEPYSVQASYADYVRDPVPSGVSLPTEVGAEDRLNLLLAFRMREALELIK